MHPDDVRDVVVAETARLEAELQLYPELGVLAVELVDFELRIRFAKRTRPAVRADVPAGIQLPGGAQAMTTFIGVDLRHTEQRELLLAMGCDDYDGQPPTAELRDSTGVLLPDAEWPRELGGQGVVFGFEQYGRPFFCRRGLREFHDHPQHEDTPWDRYREGLRLHRIALELLDDLTHRWVIQTHT